MIHLLDERGVCGGLLIGENDRTERFTKVFHMAIYEKEIYPPPQDK